MADEPQFMLFRDDNAEFQQTVLDAQRTLADFRRHVLAFGPTASACVKTLITDDDERAYIWLLVAQLEGDDFIGSVFEIPPEFVHFGVGDYIRVPAADVMDWMLNDRGTLHGGYSLRLQRSKLPPEKHDWYDRHIGVTHYAAEAT